MLEVEKLSKTFGDLQVLRQVSAQFLEGQTTVLLGPSGSGKSTFLRCLNLLETPESGRLRIARAAVGGENSGEVSAAGLAGGEAGAGTEIDFGSPISTARREAWKRRFGMVFQSFNLFPHMSALENVTVGPIQVLGQNRQEAAERGRELLARVGLAERAQAYPATLSGGQQQRVAIARALAMDPQFLLFDEPTSALDPELEGEVIKVMEDLAGENRTQLVVTHNMGFAREAADRILFLEGGEIAFSGPPAEFFAAPTERIAAFLSTHRLQPHQ